jgi:hypothetical protein
MKIINLSIPSLNTYDSSNPQLTWSHNLTAGASALREATYLEGEAWYCIFSCEHSFRIYKIKSLIDETNLEKVINKTAFIVLDNALEPFERSIDSIYENVVIQEGIPASQIILLTNMYDAKKYSDELAKKLNQEPIRIFWYKVFEQDLKNAVEYIHWQKMPKTLSLKSYSKKFLNFNRRWRLHRPFLITLLHGRNLIDKGHVSFGPCDQKDNWKYRWQELMYGFRNDPDMINLLTQYESVKTIPPLFLDTTELHINRAESTVSTDRYYEDTYFSVVTETTYFTRDWHSRARFLSEKAFKPIAMRHPFIIASVPNTLEIYKIMGYKTFSSIIDESYDQELDDGKRMLMIVDEIERLCNLNESELIEFLSAAKEICDYNFNLLISKKHFIEEM